MHIDVDFPRVKFDKDDGLRVIAARQPALVGLAHRGEQAFVRDGTAVDEEEYAVGPGLADIGLRGHAVHAYAVPRGIEGTEGIDDEPGPDLRQPVLEVLAREKANGLPLSRAEGKGDVGPCQGEARQPVLGSLQLRRGAFEEFETGGDVFEKAAHLNERALVQGRRA